MKKKFENINYKDTVGNIIFDEEKIEYATGKNSINDKDLKIEIFIKDIDKKRMKKALQECNMQIIDIETKNNKYTFKFNFSDVFKDFLDDIYNIV